MPQTCQCAFNFTLLEFQRMKIHTFQIKLNKFFTQVLLISCHNLGVAGSILKQHALVSVFGDLFSSYFVSDRRHHHSVRWNWGIVKYLCWWDMQKQSSRGASQKNSGTGAVLWILWIFIRAPPVAASGFEWCNLNCLLFFPDQHHHHIVELYPLETFYKVKNETVQTCSFIGKRIRYSCFL